MDKLIELGHVVVCVRNKKTTHTLYTLSKNSIKMVMEYYEYLSGEKTLDKDNKLKNPFKRKDATKVDKLREKIMLKLKNQSEKKPSLFRRSLY